MSLAGVARETLAIVERGTYRAPSGRVVDVRALVDAAVRGTVLYRPDDALPVVQRRGSAGAPRIEVTPETTGEAARRLVEREGEARVVALDFASAKNPGGGFLGGAKAQEEDLARCSALYTCQLTQRDYYEANRACGTMLYTDHVIYAPEVPFFRDERYALLEAPFCASIITAPAPNAGEAFRHREPDAARRVREALGTRARRVLAVAAAHGHRCVVLGAWGCGVFHNDPHQVADAFACALADPALADAFDRVLFAVYERGTGGANRAAFTARFAGA